MDDAGRGAGDQGEIRQGGESVIYCQGYPEEDSGHGDFWHEANVLLLAITGEVEGGKLTPRRRREPRLPRAQRAARLRPRGRGGGG